MQRYKLLDPEAEEILSEILIAYMNPNAVST